MSEQQTCTVYYTVEAASDLTRGHGIGWDNNPAAAGAAIQGFADTDCLAGYNVKCNVGPTSIAIAGAALDGTVQDLEMDANGRVIPTAGGTVVAKLKVGQTAAAAGDIVEVFPLIVAS